MQSTTSRFKLFIFIFVIFIVGLHNGSTRETTGKKSDIPSKNEEIPDEFYTISCNHIADQIKALKLLSEELSILIESECVPHSPKEGSRRSRITSKNDRQMFYPLNHEMTYGNNALKFQQLQIPQSPYVPQMYNYPIRTYPFYHPLLAQNLNQKYAQFFESSNPSDSKGSININVNSNDASDPNEASEVTQKNKKRKCSKKKSNKTTNSTLDNSNNNVIISSKVNESSLANIPEDPMIPPKPT